MDAPVERRNDPRAHRSIVDHVAPGAVIQRRVEVVSTLTDPVAVRLYPGAAEIRDGSFLPSDERNQLVSWIEVEPSTVRLAPGERAQATVRIAVPRDASSGERYAVVWAELPPRGENIQVVNRVGVRVYLSVGPGGEPATDFTVESLTASRGSHGRPTVQAQVTNLGGRALDLVGELTLTEGPAGLTAGPFPAQTGTTIAPGQSAPVTVVLDTALPDGPWRARLELRSGELVRAAEATITFPAQAAAQQPPVEAEMTPVDPQKRVLVALAVALIVLTLIALAGYRWWARRV